MAQIPPEDRAAGVVAASAGNHAQGVALASSLLGIQSSVFMPVCTPAPKLAATHSYGAQVHLTGRFVDESLDAAMRYAAEAGSTFIHPFDDPRVIAGQGTVGLEVLDQCPDVDTVVVAMGGGGLAAGVALAMQSLRPDVRVVGVQTVGAAAYPESLRRGRTVRVECTQTIADGIRVSRPGTLAFEILKNRLDEVLTVSEESLSRAVMLCLQRAKMVVEPAGASTVAALLSYPDRFSGNVVAILSGGNIDPLLLQRIIETEPR
jgi:threonine dehydratase